MAILSRTGRTSARLRFTAGPGGDLPVPVAVAWADWPGQAERMPTDLASWRHEYDTRVEAAPAPSLGDRVFDVRDAANPASPPQSFDPLDIDPWESAHERSG